MQVGVFDNRNKPHSSVTNLSPSWNHNWCCCLPQTAHGFQWTISQKSIVANLHYTRKAKDLHRACKKKEMSAEEREKEKKRRKEIGDKNHRASFSPPSSSLVIRSLHTFCYTCSADKWHTRQMKHTKQEGIIVTNVEARLTRWWIGTMAKEIHFRQSFYTDSILEDLILKCHAPSFSRVQNWWTINSPSCWQHIQTNLIKCWRKGVKENQRKHINK